MKRKMLPVLVALILTLAWVGSIGASVYFQWQINQDTTANLERAMQSSNAEDMKEYLNEAERGFDKWGYTDKHYVLIFKTPYNDAARDRQALERMVERLDKIEEQPTDSTQYQVAIDDIRGTIRDTEWAPYQHWAIHGTPLAVMYWFPWLGWAFPVVAFIGTDYYLETRD